MAKLSITKSNWTGNNWPSVDIEPFKDYYFLVVLCSICAHFNVSIPPVHDILDGYCANLKIANSETIVMMDTWTFSVASESETVRDWIYLVIENIDVSS